MATRVKRSALLPYPAASVFHIVNDVSRYPEFLPWCTEVEIIEKNAREIVAALSLKARGITETFTTRNVFVPGRAIELNLVSGPFRALSGCWTFTSLGNDEGCRVELDLDFQVSGLKSVLGLVFAKAADEMVDAFCQRANNLLGSTQALG